MPNSGSGKIVEIELLADPGRLAQFNVVFLCD
jgi:hypothetical protein